MDKVGAIILAAGRGTRMKSGAINKVAISINKRPLLLRTIEILKKAGVLEIVVVVGYAKDSVIRILPSDVKFVIQEEQMGTADAERVGLKAISEDVQDVISVYGDDSFLYTSEMFNEMVKTHRDSLHMLTFATVVLGDPSGYGRILRDDAGNVNRIVEEVNASEKERDIKEVNTGCYLFNKKILIENIGKIKMDKVKSEYYLTDIVEVFAKKGYSIGSISIPRENWRGVNTPEEAILAEEVLKKNEG